MPFEAEFAGVAEHDLAVAEMMLGEIDAIRPGQEPAQLVPSLVAHAEYPPRRARADRRYPLAPLVAQKRRKKKPMKPTLTTAQKSNRTKSP